ncbi:hypothetical protein NL676_007592 [Syzygium grande]|nr:hypothetical protein NL676_007592 [Syzygium grande]
MTLAFPKPIHVPTTYKNLHHKHSISKPEKTQESSYQNQELEPKPPKKRLLILATAAVLLLLHVSASRAAHPEPLWWGGSR